MKIRVLHLLKSNIFSGAENVVCQIMSMFAGCPDVDMVYCSPDGKIRDALKEKNVPFLPLDDFSEKSLKKAFAAYQPTVVHAHDVAASVLAAKALGKRVRIISHVHCNHEDMRKFTPKSLLFRLFSHRFHHIFWVSDSSFKDYRFANAVAEKSSILYNIIRLDDLRAAADASAESFDVLYLGRLCYAKDPERLIRVFAKILEKCPDATMGIVGDGEMRNDVKRVIAELSLADKVKMLGFQSNPKPILARAKLMLMTSRYEGLPMCALEAMGLGIPIVSTPTDGLCIVVEEGENGFLREDDDGLADCAALLIRDSALRKRASLIALEKAAAWNDERVYFNTLMQYYQ